MKKENIIYGIRPIIEAIKSGKEIDKVIFQDGLKGQLFFELRDLLKEFEIPFQFVPAEKLNQITTKNHQGVVCFISSIEYQKIEDIIPLLFENGEVPLIMMLDRITDVRNFGAISRTAECAGVHAIIIPVKGSAQINEVAIKTSAGALNKIPVCRTIKTEETITFLKNSGLQIVSCTEKTEKLFYDIDYTLPSLIIIGSEEDGISKSILDKSDEIVRIPLKGEIESLNVSVAAGIVLFEVVKQRGMK
ncbi:MAG: 23S rRNA (guanosine(2251)-2'-O)-methyltransferase RlmB [Bacteroidales bacterium]